MKVEDLEGVLKNLKELKSFTDKLDYNTFSHINKLLTNIFPVLQAEYDRMDKNKITINCPQLLILGSTEKLEDQTFTSYVNDKLQELVMQGYKIIDYGLCTGFPTSEMLVYIKYTD